MLTIPTAKPASVLPAMTHAGRTGATSSRARVPAVRSSSTPRTPNSTVKKTKNTAIPIA
jgi:hypothetical protein